jgi:polyphosphate kinase
MNAADTQPVTAGATHEVPDLLDPGLYINRELSQIAFHFRVLEQACDPRVPLLERLRFLCISCTNVDEFFEVRVAAIRHQQAFSATSRPGADGLTASDALKLIRERTLELVARQYHVWNDILLPDLASQRVRFLRREQWTEKQRRWLQAYFENEVLPVLSPLGLDPAHPFPRILNKSLNLVVLLRGRDAFGREADTALVRAPRSLPRIIRLPAEICDGSDTFVFLSMILSTFVDELFPGMEVTGAYQFRVTRNSELFVDEEEVENLARALQGELAGRGFAKAVRLEIAESCPQSVTRTLMSHFELGDDEVYRCDGPVNLNRVVAVYDMLDRPDLKYPKFLPRIAPGLATGSSVFETVARGDVLLHHPFDSFAPVVDMLMQAAVDPDVLAIKQTLYRTGEDSVLVGALIEAARQGKDVTAVVELRARFDEAANIQLADRMQEAGVQVVYGVVGFKTHAKMLLIVRREGGHLRRYVHLGTGNYHPGTARAYTDIALLSCNSEIGEDVHQIFLQLSGLGPALKLKRLLQSPFTLHKRLLAMIEREIAHRRAGRAGRIIAKFNALTEETIIAKLYEASIAGVEIDLIVRGACALRPGLPGVSANIRVRSLVGRFLEHSRVYWFGNAGAPEIYASSADWMERNLLRRVETCFPILDDELARRAFDETLDNYLADNQQSWRLAAGGGCHQIVPGASEPYSAQDALLAKLCND